MTNTDMKVMDILESMGDGFIALDKDFNILRVNHQQERISGLKREQTVGRNHWDIWPKEIVPKLWLAYHKVLREKVAVHLEEFNSQLNIWLSVDAFPTPENGLAVFFRDITQQKINSQALKDSEGQFRDFADSMPQLAWIAQSDGFIFWYNKGWYEYTGTKAQDMEGWGWQSVHDPVALPKVLERWNESIATGNNFEMTFPLKRADGEFRSFLTRVIPIRGADGKIIRWFGTNTDITERERLESQLLKALEQANEASRLKSAFLANMSHEIRTPLGVLIGFADLISDPDISSDERKQYAATLKRNGEHLTAIVNDILDLSKVEAGHLKVECRPFNLCSVVEDVFSALKVMAEEKGLELRIEGAPLDQPIQVMSDPTRLRQILWNLIGNSIKFTHKGSIILCIAKVNGTIQLEVKDTGVGISTADQKKLFKPFSQADESMTRKFGGTGLGLVLSKRLSELLGGSLELRESEVGRGSTFRVSIKNYLTELQHNGKHAQLHPQPKPHTNISSATVDLTNLKILIVDDSEDNQHLIWRLLSNRGATVHLASNGLEAVAKATLGRYNLIIMDIQMPVMDGYTATQRLRELGLTVPIIALTAHAMSEIRQKCLDVGCTDWAPKPINLNDLLAKVVQYTK